MNLYSASYKYSSGRSGGSRKKYLRGLAPHHLGGNHARLSEITIEPISGVLPKI